MSINFDILFKILGLYPKIIEENLQTTTGYLCYLLTNFTSSKKYDLTNIYNAVLTETDLLKSKGKSLTAVDVFDYIYLLGERAQAAQNLKSEISQANSTLSKFFFEAESNLALILHMARSYCVNCLRDTGLLDQEITDLYKILLTEEKEVFKIENKAEDTFENKIKNFENVKYTLMKLVFLEDIEAFIEARQLQLLNAHFYNKVELKDKFCIDVQHINEFFPVWLQKNIHLDLPNYFHKNFSLAKPVELIELKNQITKHKQINLEAVNPASILPKKNSVMNEISNHFDTLDNNIPLYSDLPCTQVFIDYFTAYPDARRRQWESLLGQAKKYLDRIISYFTGQNTSAETINKILENIRRKLNAIDETSNDNKKFCLWFSLIFILGEQAQLAEEKENIIVKYIKDYAQKNFVITFPEQSLLCETLHALRNYIVEIFKHKDCSYHERFIDEVKKLRKDLQSISLRLYQAVAFKHGKDSQQLLEDFKNLSAKLVYLEDWPTAWLYARMPYLKCYLRDDLIKIYQLSGDEVNPFLPYVLQSGLCKSIFEKHYQSFLIQNLQLQGINIDRESSFSQYLEKIQKLKAINAQHVSLKACSDKMHFTLLAQVTDDGAKFNENEPYEKLIPHH